MSKDNPTVTEQAQRFEQGNGGHQMSGAQAQQEVQGIYDRYKNNNDMPGYRKFIDSVYNQVHTDAAKDPKGNLASILPAIDITDSAVSSKTDPSAAADRAKLKDGLNYGNVGTEDGTTHAKSWSDGQSGVAVGKDGTMSSFNTDEQGLHTNTITGDGQSHQWNYGANAKAGLNGDGNMQIQTQDNRTVTLQPNGSEQVQMPDNGPVITRQYPGSQDVTQYQASANGPQLIGADGNWTKDAPQGLQGQPAKNYEVDPANGSVYVQGHKDQVVAKMSDGKLQQTSAEGGIQSTLPSGVVKTSYDDPNHVEYRQGDQSIWTTDGNQWYAKRDNGDTIKVDAPDQESLKKGEVRTANQSDDFILGGDPSAGRRNGWTGKGGTPEVAITPQDE